MHIIRETALLVLDGDFFRVLDACLRAQGVTLPVSINLRITDEAGIRETNRDWRGVDSVTDVLSFPMMDYVPGQVLTNALLRKSLLYNPEEGAYELGDVVLCAQRVAEQAAEYGHGLRREATYLLAHGIYHLMGYDHENGEDKRRMRDMEEKALDAMDAGGRDEELLRASRQARERAYAPYSGFKVGAALLSKSGAVYTGCNVENISYGLTCCAERTALFKAVSEGDTTFDAIAISAQGTPPWPCGACRQALSEFAPQLKVLITWDDGKTDSAKLSELLPHSFLRFRKDTHD